MSKVFDPYSIGLDVKAIKDDEASCLCPYHSDHRPSASFNVVTGLFHCFSCGASSSARTLARDLGGQVLTTDSVAIMKAKDEAEWRNVVTAPLAYDNPYLESRGVPNALVEAYEIRALPNGVAFINYDTRGRAIGAQVRQYEGTPRYLFYGDRAPLWPMQALKLNPCVIYLTEGVFGALRGLAAGKVAMATMGAGSLQAVSRILNGRKKVVVFDDDFAGHLGAAKLLSLGGFHALIPGLEADELPLEQWAEIEERFEITSNFNYFLALEPSNYHKMLKLIRKFRG